MDITELQRALVDEQTFLRNYEEQLGLEDDPRKRKSLENQIVYAKTQIKGLQVQLQEHGEMVASGTGEERELIYSSLPRQPFFFGREKELAIIAKAITPETRTWGVLIDGPGGIGKTSLAIRAGELAPTADFEYKIFLSAKVREMTPAGEQSLDDFKFTNFLSLLTELAHELGDDELARLDPSQRTRAVLRTLAGIDALLIIDNIETFPEPERIRLYQFLARLPRSCKAIVTSRRRTDIDARIVRLDRLAKADALQLIAELGKNNRRLARVSPSARDELYEITNGNPLLIRWLAGQLGRVGSQCRTIRQACAFLEKAPKDNDPLEYIFGDLLDTFSESETAVLTALVHFDHPAKIKWIADVADIAELTARTALEDLADRALLVGDETEETFFLPPLAATFLRRKHPEAVMQTGDRLTDRVYALILENGYEKYARFPKLEAEWQIIATTLPLFLEGDNNRLQSVCNALDGFLNFSGRWDERLSLSQHAEEKAVAAEDFFHAGWRAYRTGWIYYLRGHAFETLACVTRCAAHWEKSPWRGGTEKAEAIRLGGLGYELEKNYPAAIDALQETLALYRAISPESEDVAIGLTSLANVERAQGKYDTAERHYREALRIAKKVNEQEIIAGCTGNLAELALDREEWVVGEVLARKALSLSEKIGSQEIIGYDCTRLAKALMQQDKTQEGLPYARRAVEIFTYLRKPNNLEEARAVLKKCCG